VQMVQNIACPAFEQLGRPNIQFTPEFIMPCSLALIVRSIFSLVFDGPGLESMTDNPPTQHVCLVLVCFCVNIKEANSVSIERILEQAKETSQRCMLIARLY